MSTQNIPSANDCPHDLDGCAAGAEGFCNDSEHQAARLESVRAERDQLRERIAASLIREGKAQQNERRYRAALEAARERVRLLADAIPGTGTLTQEARAIEAMAREALETP